MSSTGIVLVIFGVWIVLRTVVPDSNGHTLVWHIQNLGSNSDNSSSSSIGAVTTTTNPLTSSGTAAARAAAAATVLAHDPSAQ